MEWQFKLNDQATSALNFGLMSFPAFSGTGSYKNKRSLQCVASMGAIPIGTYYILQRESGGHLGWVRELWAGNDKRDWFALYADDGKIDDETFCAKVKRALFGCIRKAPWGSARAA